MQVLIEIITKWLVSGFALWLTALIVPGFRLKSFGAALIATIIVGIANMTVWPLIAFLTLPLTIITLGLFLFVVNAIVLRICAAILKDFEITNWFSAIAGAVVLSVVNYVIHGYII
ncbi:MAG: phage holin family protein [Bdellovibrionia bacterium]